MSKLLIPASGQPSERISHTGGGVVLAPNSRISSMKYDIKGGCVAYGISTAAGTADLNVNGLYFPGSSNKLFVTSINGQALALTKIVGAAGLLLSSDDTNGDGQVFSSYYENGTITYDKIEGNSTFTVGKEFYMKATFQLSSIASDKNGDIFIGFAEAATHQDEPNALTEAYGLKIGEDHSDDGSVFEQSSTASTATFADTATACLAATDKTVEIKVTAAGVASLVVDGTDLTQNGKTFSAGTILRPIIYNVETGGGETQHLSALEFGFTNARK